MKRYANKLGIKWYGNRFKMQLRGCYKMEINSKAFAIPILTASTLTLNTDLGGNFLLLRTAGDNHDSISITISG